MLTKERNETLTRVGPGTPMGTLLRRYWHPVAAATEFDRRSVKPIRLLGEDLVLYRDASGRYGLVDRHCPHRGADMAHAYVEEHGIRCHYHGWLFSEGGRCMHQPFEDTVYPHRKLKEKICIKHYPVEEKAGLIWACLGPAPAPLVPDWEPFSWPHGFRQIVFCEVPCNWLQCQENSIDPVHFEWMHENWTRRIQGDSGEYSPRHLKLRFEEFEHGLIYKRVRENSTENDPPWTVGRVALWPNGFFLGSHFEWRVPMDDENTLSVVWTFDRVPKEREPFTQDRIPHWYAPIYDEEGKLLTSHVINQDIVAWVGQGRIADRTREHPGPSDRGVMMMRRRFMRDIQAVQRGEEPSGVLRDPAANHRVFLPSASRQAQIEGRTLKEMMADKLTRSRLVDFPFLAGQPLEVREAFEAALGIAELRRREKSRGGVFSLVEK